MKKAAVLLFAVTLLLAGCGQRDLQEPPAQSQTSSAPSSSEETKQEQEDEGNDGDEDKEPAAPFDEIQPQQEVPQPVSNENPGAENPATMGRPDMEVTYRNLNPEGMLDMFLYNPADYTYQRHFHWMHTETMQDIVDEIDWSAGIAVPADADLGKGLLFTLYDHTKLTFRLAQTANGSYLQIGDQLYPVTSQQFEAVKDDIATGEQMSGLLPVPQWLVWMNPGRAQMVAISDPKEVTQTSQQWEAQTIAENCRHIGVLAGGTTTYSGQQPVNPGDEYIGIVFDSGITYRLIHSGDYLYVESSDRDMGIRYTFANAGNTGTEFSSLYTFLTDN